MSKRSHTGSIVIPRGASETSSMVGDPNNGGAEEPNVKPFGRISTLAPEYFTIKLRYMDILSLTSGVADGNLIYSGNFRLNDITKPGAVPATRPGVWTNPHEPRGWSAWSGVYSHFRILANDIKVKFYHAYQYDVATTKVEPLTCGFYLSTDSDPSLWNNATDFYEMKKTASKMLYPAIEEHDEVNFTYHYEPEKYIEHVGVVDSGDYSSYATKWRLCSSGNPGNVNHLIHLGCVNTNAVKTEGYSVKCVVQSEYTIQFRNSDDAINNTIVDL